MRSAASRASLALVSSLALAASASAQAVWTIQSDGSVVLHDGPPAGPCGAPLGPLQSLWSHVVPGQCKTPAAIASGTLVPGAGDVGLDRFENLVWITDGETAAAYQAFGTPVITGIDVHGLLGGVCTGLDWDPTLSRLWLTDGFKVVSATLQFDGTCYDANQVTSFTLPAGGYASALTHDPVTGTLFVVDFAGGLTHLTKAGAVGPFGSIDVVGAGTCGLTGPLLGVAADPAGPAGRVYVTDGARIAVVDAAGGGVAAAPTPYTPVSCYAAPFAPLEGLAIGAVGNLYGASSGSPFPAIGAVGQSIVPSFNFAVEVGGAQDGEIAVLVMGKQILCPAATVLGVPLNVAPPLITIATKTIGPTGFASVPLPLGLGTPIGKTVFLQWALFDPATLTLDSTRALGMTTSLP